MTGRLRRDPIVPWRSGGALLLILLACGGCALMHAQARLHLAAGEKDFSARNIDAALVEFARPSSSIPNSPRLIHA